MDLKVVVLVALALGIGFAASETDFAKNGFNSITSENSSVFGPTIQDLHLNGSNYVGEKVSLSGEAGFSLRSSWTKSWLTDGDYSVRVDCSNYVDLQPGDSYSIEGIVENKTVTERKTGQPNIQKEIVYVKCSSPP